jgi:hypothetical protein
MALGDFDSNQSSFEFGQSLLVDKDRRDKKARKRQKKMKNVSYLLGTVAVADMFMANKARKKAELFQENLTTEMASEIHKQNKAEKFYNNQLKVLLQDNPGIDLEGAGIWDENGSLWNAIEKLMANEAKGSANIGTATTVAGSKQFTTDEYDLFIKETNRRTANAVKTLKAQYLKHKGYLGETEKLIESRYKEIMDHGVRDIMSAKNTSSIRKLLSKFDLLNDVDSDLKLIEDRSIGGVDKIYINKDIANRYRKRILENTDNIKKYNEEMAGMVLDLEEIKLKPFTKSTQSSELRSLSTEHPLGYKGSRGIFGQLNSQGKYLGTPESEAWASAWGQGRVPKNPRISSFDSFVIDGKTPLSNFPDFIEGDPDSVTTFSKFWDELYQQEDDETKSIQNQSDFVAAFDARLYTILSKKEITILGKGADPKTTIKPQPTDEDYARAINDVLDKDIGWDKEIDKYTIKTSLRKEDSPTINSEDELIGKSGQVVKLDEVSERLIPEILNSDKTLSEKIQLIEGTKEEYAEYPELIEIFDQQIKEIGGISFSEEAAMLTNIQSLEAQERQRKKLEAIKQRNIEKAKSLSLETDDTETEEDILDKYPWLSDN